MLRNCIYHLCDDAVPLFHVRKRRFPIQLPGLSKNHESERNQLMKKSNRKKILTVCRACTVSCSTFRTTGCQPASDCRHYPDRYRSHAVQLSSPAFHGTPEKQSISYENAQKELVIWKEHLIWKPFSGDRSNSRLPESSRKPSRMPHGIL